MTYDLAGVEGELCRIPEVRAARIVSDDDGQPVEVHVLAVPGKHAKQLVRDVQSVAMATVGLTLDHRIVSVVQLDEPLDGSRSANGGGARGRAEGPDDPESVIVLDDAPGVERADVAPAAWRSDAQAGDSRTSEPWASDARHHVDGADGASSEAPAPRVVLERVVALRGELTCTAEVVLRRDGEIVTGTATGSAAVSATHRLVAEATLAALCQLHPGAGRASVEVATVATVGSRSIAVATVVLLVPPNEELLTGSSPVRGAGEHDAIARSILDATNRRLCAEGQPSR